MNNFHFDTRNMSCEEIASVLARPLVNRREIRVTYIVQESRVDEIVDIHMMFAGKVEVMSDVDVWMRAIRENGEPEDVTICFDEILSIQSPECFAPL